MKLKKKDLDFKMGKDTTKISECSIGKEFKVKKKKEKYPYTNFK